MSKYVTVILVCTLLFQLFGCYSLQEITKEEFKQHVENRTLRLSTEKYRYTLKASNYWFVNDTVFGNGKMYMNKDKTYAKELVVDIDDKIALSDIKKIEIEKFNLLLTSIAIGLPLALIISYGISINLHPFGK